MDVIASQKLNELMNNTEDEDDQLGVIFNWICYDNTTQLNIEEAKKLFSLSYEQGNFYDYELYESVYYAGKCIVYHVLFIIMFLVILVN